MIKLFYYALVSNNKSPFDISSIVWYFGIQNVQYMFGSIPEII